MFLLDDAVLVRDAVVMVVEKLGISEGDPLAVAPYFAIYECPDGKSIQNHIPPEYILTETVKNASDPSYKLVFMIRLYMPSLWGIEFRDFVARRLDKPVNFISDEVYLESADVIDEELLRIQFIQAIYFVITGQYYTTEQQILKLSSYHFFYKFGAYKPQIHKKGFLNERIVEFIPLRHLKDKGFEVWESKLFEYVGGTAQYEYQFESQSEAQRKYMDEIYSMDTYGRTFFKCNIQGLIDPDEENINANSKDIKESRKVLIGVHTNGIDIYDKSIARGLLCSFSYGELLSWGYSSIADCFYLKLPNVNPIDREPYKIVGRRGILEFFPADSGDDWRKLHISKSISDLMTDYALSFARECTFEDARNGNTHGNTRSSMHKDDAGLHADVGPDMIPSNDESNDTPHEEFTKSAPKGAIFSPRAQLEKAKAEARQKPSMSPAKAATLIQSSFRGYSLRIAWVREACAEVIQSVWRGALARMRVETMIANAMDAFEEDECSD